MSIVFYNLVKNEKKNDKRRLLYKTLSQISIIVIRVGPMDDLKMSKPCSKCAEIMKKLGIKKVYYSTGEKEIYKCEKIKNLVADIKYKEKPLCA
jgi:hypothetical protein